MQTHRRPTLLLGIEPLGPVDPFALDVLEEPPDSGKFCVRTEEASLSVTRAGLHLMGAANALCELSATWMDRVGAPAAEPPSLGPMLALGGVHFILRRRDARLLTSLLKRHLARLPQPPAWMTDLHRSLEEVQVLLQWSRG